MLLHVRLPLQCQVRDRNGCIRTAAAFLESDVCMSGRRSCTDAWHGTLMLQPSVRLACMPAPSCDLCFDTQLEVLIEAYLVRWEPYGASGCDQPLSAMRNVPLYPELPMR